MIRRHFSLCATVILLTMTLCACKGKNEDSARPSGPTETPPAAMLKIPFKNPIEPVLYELTSSALATWRDYAKYRPTLVLYSTHPLLDPTLDPHKKAIEKLLWQGTAAEIVQRARNLSANPVFLPTQAVSVAIDNGLLSELVIVLPNLKKPEEVNLSEIGNRLYSSGYLSREDAEGLTLKDGVISGKVRGLPLRIVHPERLPKILTPVILHVDLGFFKDMYVNEVKTPSYGLLHQLATTVRDAGFPTLTTTLSFSNQEIGFSLESRFLIRDLATLLRAPALLDGNTPPSWELRAKALYMTTMLDEGTARELTRQAAQTSPDDAAAQYALALDLFEQKLADGGFATLDRAVALDHGYSLDYLYLAETGFSMGKNEKSLELLFKAAQAMPENDFIRVELADKLIRAGRAKEARPLIAALRKLDWSPEIHPDTPGRLKEMEEAAASDAIPPPQTPPAKQPQKPAGGMPGFNHMGMGIPGK